MRPELELDKTKGTTVAQLQLRLAGFWLADETVVYIGRSSRPLAARIAEFYGHRLGASSPHKGGWPLKTLAVLDKRWVHPSALPAPEVIAAQIVEDATAGIEAFAAVAAELMARSGNGGDAGTDNGDEQDAVDALLPDKPVG